jgi:ribosomal protein S18 acetylase RimI-like enzyme
MPSIRPYQTADWHSFITLETETCLASIDLEVDKARLTLRWPQFIKESYGWDSGPSPGPSIGKHTVLVLQADDGGYAGHVWLSEQNDFFTERAKLYITTLAVNARYRKQGFGERLLEHALGQAKSWDIEIVALAVDARNAGAIALYEKFGFQTARLSMSRSTSSLARA